MDLNERIDRRLTFFDKLLEIRRSLDSLRDTAATTPVSDCISTKGNQLRNDDLMPLNTWFIPQDRLTDTRAGGRSIVNPAYPHTHRFSPIFSKVEITNIITSADGDCDTELNSTQYKERMAEARQEFKEERWKFIKKAADHNYSIYDITKRLETDDEKYVYKIAEKHDQDYRRMRMKGRDKVARVMEELYYEGDYSHAEIAEVYGVGRSTVTEYINDPQIGARKL